MDEEEKYAKLEELGNTREILINRCLELESTLLRNKAELLNTDLLIRQLDPNYFTGGY